MGTATRRSKISNSVSKQPHEQLKSFLKLKNPKDEDFANLRSGWDPYSKMKVGTLLEQANQQDTEEIKKNLKSDAEIARALRWTFRGLPVQKSIRKVQVDVEMRSRKPAPKVLAGDPRRAMGAGDDPR